MPFGNKTAFVKKNIAAHLDPELGHLQAPTKGAEKAGDKQTILFLRKKQEFAKKSRLRAARVRFNYDKL